MLSWFGVDHFAKRALGLALLSVLLAACSAAQGTPPVPVATATSPANAVSAAAPASPSAGAPANPARAELPVAPTATPTEPFDDQSSRVPPGFPTPTTAGQRLVPGGPPRDPGSLAWAHAGPYIQPGWTDFKLNSFLSSQRLATTYYFYWHDLTNPTRLARFASGQFDSPPDPAHYSFLLPQTHEREFQDMIDAGLDFVLPVYWGEPGHPGRTTAETVPHYWSTEGIPPMVQALESLHAAGKHLQMGMFYDTTILANADLTTPNGKAYFYVNIRDFYSRIPPQFWAAIDGHPVVWLYDTLWVSRFDQSTFDYVDRRFAQDFGGLTPYVVRESQWEVSKGTPRPEPIHTAGLYGWGAAASGYNPNPKFTVAEVGPGFTNTAYCKGGPAQNCFNVSRQNGAYYAHQLQQAVAGAHHLLAVETWNEFSEGTDVQETTKYGRQYINLTRQYVNQFKAHAG